MALFKSVNLGKNADHPDLIRNEINYILRTDKNVRRWGGYNVLLTDKESVIEQFYAVRQVYRRFNGIQVRHFVLAFSYEYEDDITPYQAYSIGYQIAEIFWHEHQIIFAVHEKPERLHIHFLVNAVNFCTGELLDLNGYVYNDIWRQVESILKMPHLWHGYRAVRLFGADDWN